MEQRSSDLLQVVRKEQIDALEHFSSCGSLFTPNWAWGLGLSLNRFHPFRQPVTDRHAYQAAPKVTSGPS